MKHCRLKYRADYEIVDVIILFNELPLRKWGRFHHLE